MDHAQRDSGLAGAEQRLCLACGLCCNGVLFKDVELQEEDDPARLSALGFPLRVRRGGTGQREAANRVAGAKVLLPQPCPALFGCRCTVYGERPARCRQFDCALLLRFRAGEVSEPEARRIIERTRGRGEKVLRALRALGCGDEKTALSLRFQRLRRRFDREGPADEAVAEGYADLTLAVHDLQHALQRDFYP